MGKIFHNANLNVSATIRNLKSGESETIVCDVRKSLYIRSVVSRLGGIEEYHIKKMDGGLTITRL